jgi:Uma2 family endonuclease
MNERQAALAAGATPDRRAVVMNPTVPTPPTVPPAGVEPVYVLDPADWPKIDHLITEDDAPVDSIYTEKQQRLLTEPLYSSWPGPGEGRPFLALANVGLFNVPKNPAWVPDCLLSLGVTAGEDLHEKENRSYFVWLMGKPPDVVIEVVSDRRGGEEGLKPSAYAHMGVPFYVIYDPKNLLGNGVLRAFAIQRGRYQPTEPDWFPEVGLGLRLWEGSYEGQRATWLRWGDQEGHVIPTGAERAEDERRRADEVTARLERLAAQLRALGAEPEP